MLGKLIKHEFKDISLVFLIMYIAIIVVAAVDRIFLYLNSDWMFIEVLQEVLTTTYVLGILAIFVMAVILIVKRFYDNLLKDQGYLSFTLPVSTNAHIFSKLLVSFIMCILTCIVAIITVCIMFIGEVSFADFAKELNEIFTLINEYHLWSIVIKTILVILIGIITGIVEFYFCLSVGQLFNKHKILGAVGVYFGLYIVSQIIGMIIITITSRVVYSVATEIEFVTSYFDLIMTLELFILVLEFIIFYIGSVLILDKKLNLE